MSEMSKSNQPAALFYPALQRYLQQAAERTETVAADRRAALEQVANYIRQRGPTETTRLTFICTHNSRRSHLGQIWARVAAVQHGLPYIETYSGGTEATAFNPRAVAALQRCGLQITTADPTATNPRYSVSFSDAWPAMECFSKIYDAAPNPNTGYAAIMTCTEADQACPLVPGCDLRAPIRYEDPKVADDTPEESERYDQRCQQICTEMLYLMAATSR
jgi:arsenate reductase